MMRQATLITPYFLATPRTALADLARANARVSAAVPHAVSDIDLAPGPDKAGIQQAVAPVHRAIAAFVADTVRSGTLPVSLAGDCCAAIPMLAGLQTAGLDPVLVWLDAHGDFNTWETSPSGFLGGMPLAMMAGRGDMTMMQSAGAQILSEADIFLCDGRDLDPEEAEALEESEVRLFADPEDVLAALPRDRPIYVHFDTDIISSEDVPAQSYPVPGGPSAADMKTFLVKLAEHGTIAGLSLSSWNPDLDTDGNSARLCLDCLDGFLDALR
ncbi:MAG: arginase family protein [Pseudomonadota bacterium]